MISILCLFYLLLSVKDLQHQRGGGVGPHLPGQEQQEQQYDRLEEKGQSSPRKNVIKVYDISGVAIKCK